MCYRVLLGLDSGQQCLVSTMSTIDAQQLHCGEDPSVALTQIVNPKPQAPNPKPQARNLRPKSFNEHLEAWQPGQRESPYKPSPKSVHAYERSRSIPMHFGVQDFSLGLFPPI